MKALFLALVLSAIAFAFGFILAKGWLSKIIEFFQNFGK